MRQRLFLAFLAVAGSITTASALPCTLTEQDYQSLANGRVKYAKAEIDRLDAKTQDNLCKVHKFHDYARGKDPDSFAKTRTIFDYPSAIANFLTTSEYDEIKLALSRILANSVIEQNLNQRRQ